MFIRCLIFFMALGFLPAAYALDLERPTIEHKQVRDSVLWGQYDVFDKGMDIIGYSQRLKPKESKIDHVDSESLGLLYVPYNDIQLAYTFNANQQRVKRSAKPMLIETQTLGHHLRGQWRFWGKTTAEKSFDLALELGLKSHQTQPLNFYQFESNRLLLTWPGHPVFSLKANDFSYISALRGRYTQKKWTLHVGLEMRYVRVSAKMSSGNSTITSILQSEAPQATPWHEIHTLIQFSADYQISPSWRVAADVQHYQITRNQYIPRKGKKDYNANDTLDTYLLWQASPAFQPYLHAHLSKNFMLGTLPLSYNQRSNHKFKHPFAFVSIGAQYAF